jgi:UDP-hydrolysing UDP-N-acetyl-D-glucosamine 2-epimerase
MKKRKICVVLVDRANYGRLKPVMKAIESHHILELQTICSGTMLLERFGQVENIVKSDGFDIDARVYMEVEGSIPTTMAKSVGFGIIEFASALQRLSPQIVVVIGDRYEALSAVIAAAFQNIPIAHIQGGEVSSSIDESTRHSITKFSQYHFPSTDRSKDFIIRMGELESTVFNYGCPVGDIILGLENKLAKDIINHNGAGANISPDKPFFLVIFHPITTQFNKEVGQVQKLLDALEFFKHPTVWLWPNIDAGSDHISKELRKFRINRGQSWLRLVKNFEPMEFQKILKQATCAIGNSSSFIRDSSFSGTPVVLVGSRQNGREYAENLIETDMSSNEIKDAIAKQLQHGRYKKSTLYGDGNASINIANKLAEVDLYIQKKLDYL